MLNAELQTVLGERKWLRSGLVLLFYFRVRSFCFVFSFVWFGLFVDKDSLASELRV